MICAASGIAARVRGFKAPMLHKVTRSGLRYTRLMLGIRGLRAQGRQERMVAPELPARTKPQAPRTLDCAILGVYGLAEIASSAFVNLAKSLITGVL
jgi:hypothetical protein